MPRIPLLLRSATLAAAATIAALAGATGASAAITLTASGSTITVTGSGDNETYVGFTNTYDPAGTVTFRNSTGVTNATGGVCVQEDVTTLGSYFHCPNTTTAVVANYGAGNDRFTLEGVCIPQVTAALGDGSNEFFQSYTDGCAGASPRPKLTVTGGNGYDLLNGGVGDDVINGLGGNDDLRGYDGNDTIDGGEGNDTLNGHAGDDTLLGGGGDDKLSGREGNDVLDGQAGNDILAWSDDPDPGADDLRGGAGTDEVYFNFHAYGIAVSPDDQANDGTPGEGDNVRSDVERFRLTPGDDVFVGSPNRDIVDGWGGNDELHGGGGDDDLETQGGDDKLFGDAGNDKIIGGNGNDALDGGAGLDSLYGDSVKCDAYSCLAGADRISARDGELDTVSCGAGADVAVVDQQDVVAGDGFTSCESLDRAAAPPVEDPKKGKTDPGKQTAPAAFTGAKAVAGRRRFSLSLTLRAAAKVTVTVTRKGARKALGKVTFKAKKGKVKRGFSKIGRKRLTRGTYRVVVRVGKTSRTLTVKVK
ncbi:calcium-binding protein [Patulibacter sp. NPDC049589]|uniref:calcium-binding protein n=1 Tax=Patulibacter sp. NPDC049589 TaxID=3154731 RepID=UPI003413FAF9